jgi:mRNA interferase YafQ
MKKRGKDLSLLDEIVGKLQRDEPLEEKNHDHDLTGNFTGFRECHIEPDWLLVYYKTDEVLTLTLVNTGSHSDLFKR